MILKAVKLSLATLLFINHIPIANSSPTPVVRLLFPIIQGTELDRLAPVAPNAKIVQVGGENYVLIGSFSDARVAHRLGRSIQKRLAIPFDLAYDPGHPQINLAMGGAQELERTPDGSTARRTPAVAGAGRAMASRSIGSSPSIGALPGAPRQDVSPGQPPRLPPAYAEFWRPLTLQGLAVNSDPTTPAGPPVGKHVAPSAPEARETALADSPRHDPPMSDASVRITAKARTHTHPWIKSVAIEKVAMGLRISKLPPAVNPSLDYLIVPVRSGDDLARLRIIIPNPALTLHGEALLATVGIYTRSSKGVAMRDAQLALFQRQSFKPLLVKGGTELELQA